MTLTNSESNLQHKDAGGVRAPGSDIVSHTENLLSSLLLVKIDRICSYLNVLLMWSTLNRCFTLKHRNHSSVAVSKQCSPLVELYKVSDISVY